jgi:outer membrane receptor protein involved in Fe transport
MSKRIFYRLSCYFLLYFSLLCSVHATDKRLDIDELIDLPIEELVQVSIATGKKQSLAKAPAIASVITSEDIEAMGAEDIDAVLETVPGLHVSRSSTYNSIYTIRGMYSSNNPQVLVLINGIPVNMLSYGNRSIAWGGMPVNAIARIEIIRGPGSALFGSDAFAGVINIITKNKTDIKGTEVGSRLGNFNTQDAWILHGDVYRDVDVAVMVEYHDTDGQDSLIEQDAQTAFDQEFGTYASHAPGAINLHKNNLDVRTELSYRGWKLRGGYQKRDKQGTGAGFSEALDPNGYLSDNRLSVDLTYRDPALTKNWDVTAQVSYLHSDLKMDLNLLPPGAFNNGYPAGLLLKSNGLERHVNLDLTGFYSGWTNHSIRIGLGYTYGSLYQYNEQVNYNNASGKPYNTDASLVDVSGTAGASLTPKTRQNWHAFAQDVYAFATDWEFTAGLRYDYYSDFNSTLNPRLALVWQPLSNLTTKLLYGQAFRSPSFNELYSRNNPDMLGNPNLKAETIQTTELGADYYLNDRMNFSLNLYRYRWRNAIQYELGEHGTSVAQNIGTQTGQGFELEGRWQVTKVLKLTGNYSQQYSKNAEGNKPGSAPSHEIYIRTDWLFMPQWFLNTQVNWIADRERAENDPREKLKNYTLIDTTLRYKAKKHWSVGLGVHNLFDVTAREPSHGFSRGNVVNIPNDLPIGKRDYFIEFRYEF